MILLFSLLFPIIAAKKWKEYPEQDIQNFVQPKLCHQDTIGRPDKRAANVTVDKADVYWLYQYVGCLERLYGSIEAESKKRVLDAFYEDWQERKENAPTGSTFQRPNYEELVDSLFPARKEHAVTFEKVWVHHAVTFEKERLVQGQEALFGGLLDTATNIIVKNHL